MTYEILCKFVPPDAFHLHPPLLLKPAARHRWLYSGTATVVYRRGRLRRTQSAGANEVIYMTIAAYDETDITPYVLLHGIYFI